MILETYNTKNLHNNSISLTTKYRHSKAREYKELNKKSIESLKEIRKGILSNSKFFKDGVIQNSEEIHSIVNTIKENCFIRYKEKSIFRCFIRIISKLGFKEFGTDLYKVSKISKDIFHLLKQKPKNENVKPLITEFKKINYPQLFAVTDLCQIMESYAKNLKYLVEIRYTYDDGNIITNFGLLHAATKANKLFVETIMPETFRNFKTESEYRAKCKDEAYNAEKEDWQNSYILMVNMCQFVEQEALKRNIICRNDDTQVYIKPLKVLEEGIPRELKVGEEISVDALSYLNGTPEEFNKLHFFDILALTETI